MSSPVQHLFKAFAAGVCFAVVANTEAAPDRVTVAWDPNPEPDIAGYNVYYGVTGSGTTNMVSPGAQTAQQIVSLEPQTQYWFYVTAFNSAGLESDPSDILSYVTPADLAPTVTLGPDRIAIIPGTISINAEAADDHLAPEDLAATWSQVAGPATVGIAGGSKFSPSFQFSTPGDYAFRVTVNDGRSQGQDEVVVHAYQQLASPPPGEVVPDIQSVFSTFDGLVIVWDSKPGENYQIAHKSDLNDPTWEVRAANVAAQGPTSYWVDTGGGESAQGFYAIFQIP